MKTSTADRDAARAIAAAARSMRTGDDIEAIAQRAANARFALVGEASHGTHEFYDIRAAVTRRLIEHHGFRVIALEADWPDTLRVHRHVTGRTSETDAAEALGDFRRFPAWMWRNTVMTDFVTWLRQWNLTQPVEERAGLFGMDLYSLHASIESVLDYLGKVDPEAARRARMRYSCFDAFGEDPQAYGYATTRGGAEPCEDAVVAQLSELRRKYGDLISRDGKLAQDEFFYAEQNARLVTNAERYYRSMFRGRERSWNLRDAHMADTLDALAEHFGGRQCRMVVWAHNSHLGDARATEMSRRGEWNVGQLMRERHGGEVCSIGFTTSTGTVTAARDWGAHHERRRVRRPLAGSCESLFHSVGRDAFWLDLQGQDDNVSAWLAQERLQRAIGVIYRPETERASHYFETRLSHQFDLVIHLDETTALEPLERTSKWDRGELPETYPEGF